MESDDYECETQPSSVGFIVLDSQAESQTKNEEENILQRWPALQTEIVKEETQEGNSPENDQDKCSMSKQKEISKVRLSLIHDSSTDDQKSKESKDILVTDSEVDVPGKHGSIINISSDAENVVSESELTEDLVEVTVIEKGGTEEETAITKEKASKTKMDLFGQLSQDDIFDDKEDDHEICTPAHFVGSLHLSNEPMLVPETVEESLAGIPPTPDYGAAPTIIPSSPTDGSFQDTSVEEQTFYNPKQESTLAEDFTEIRKRSENRTGKESKSQDKDCLQGEMNKSTKELQDSSNEPKKDVETPEYIPGKESTLAGGSDNQHSLHLHYTETQLSDRRELTSRRLKLKEADEDSIIHIHSSQSEEIDLPESQEELSLKLSPSQGSELSAVPERNRRRLPLVKSQDLVTEKRITDKSKIKYISQPTKLNTEEIRPTFMREQSSETGAEKFSQKSISTQIKKDNQALQKFTGGSMGSVQEILSEPNRIGQESENGHGTGRQESQRHAQEQGPSNKVVMQDSQRSVNIGTSQKHDPSTAAMQDSDRPVRMGTSQEPGPSHVTSGQNLKNLDLDETPPLEQVLQDSPSEMSAQLFELNRPEIYISEMIEESEENRPSIFRKTCRGSPRRKFIQEDSDEEVIIRNKITKLPNQAYNESDKEKTKLDKSIEGKDMGAVPSRTSEIELRKIPSISSEGSQSRVSIHRGTSFSTEGGYHASLEDEAVEAVQRRTPMSQDKNMKNRTTGYHNTSLVEESQKTSISQYEHGNNRNTTPGVGNGRECQKKNNAYCENEQDQRNEHASGTTSTKQMSEQISEQTPGTSSRKQVSDRVTEHTSRTASTKHMSNPKLKSPIATTPKSTKKRKRLTKLRFKNNSSPRRTGEINPPVPVVTTSSTSSGESSQALTVKPSLLSSKTTLILSPPLAKVSSTTESPILGHRPFLDSRFKVPGTSNLDRSPSLDQQLSATQNIERKTVTITIKQFEVRREVREIIHDGKVVSKTEKEETKDPVIVKVQNYQEIQASPSNPSPSRTGSSLTSGDLADVSSSLSRSSVSTAPGSLSESEGLRRQDVQSQGARLVLIFTSKEREDRMCKVKVPDYSCKRIKTSKAQTDLAQAGHTKSPEHDSQQHIDLSTHTPHVIPTETQEGELGTSIPSAVAATVCEVMEYSTEDEPAPRHADDTNRSNKRKNSTSKSGSSDQISPVVPFQDEVDLVATTEDTGVGLVVSKPVKDAKVMAKWKDGYFYPGRITKVEKSRFQVKFDDGDSSYVKENELLLIERLPLGQPVMVQSEDGYFDAGLIIKQTKKGGIMQYFVEKDSGDKELYRHSQVILNEDQAVCLFTDIPTSLSKPPAAVDPDMANISLDNLIEGKRRSGSRYEQKDMFCKSINPMTTKSSAQKSQSTSKRKFPSIPPQATSTPTPKDKHEKKRPAKKFKRDEDTPPCTDISESPIEPRRSPRKVRTGLFDKGKNPKLKLPFCGFVFLLTYVQKSKSNKEEEKSFLKDPALTSDDSSADNTDDESIPFDKDKITSEIKAGGGIVLDKYDEAVVKAAKQCFLISNAYQRTIKYMQCLAAGIPCVSHVWIKDSIAQGSLLDYNNYMLQAGLSIEKRKIMEWTKRRGDLQGLRVFVCSSQNTFVEEWSSVLKIAGCHVVTKLPPATVDSDLNVIVADSRCSKNVKRHSKKRKIPIVSSEWVIQCLINGHRLSYSGHPRYSSEFFE